MTATVRRYLGLGLGMAALTLLLDQLTKHWAISAFSGMAAAQPVTSFFNLVLVWNYGMSFGLLAEHRGLASLILGGVAGVIVFVLLCWLVKSSGRLVALALGLVIGGALGNIVDRLRFGAVADFLDFHALGYHWPAFNLADSAIFLGVALLCWDNWKGQQGEKNE